MKRGRLTEAELLQLDELAGRGLKPSQVAQRMDRHPATINWQFIIRGHKETHPQRTRTTPYRRGAVVVVPFSAEADVFMEALRVQSFSHSQIADLVTKRFGHKRSPHTIGMRLKMLAASEARS